MGPTRGHSIVFLVTLGLVVLAGIVGATFLAALGFAAFTRTGFAGSAFFAFNLAALTPRAFTSFSPNPLSWFYTSERGVKSQHLTIGYHG